MDTMNSTSFPGAASHGGQLAKLIRLCLSDPVCAKLLHFLHHRPTTCMTPLDISFHLNVSIEDVDSAIDKLDDVGLLRRLSVDGYHFYGIADDEQHAEIIQQFQRWCASVRERRDRWNSSYGVIL